MKQLIIIFVFVVLYITIIKLLDKFSISREKCFIIGFFSGIIFAFVNIIFKINFFNFK
jgi:hypothetical protein